MATAVFLGFDTVTLGTWKHVYGDNGCNIPNDQKVPPIAGTAVAITQGTTYTWSNNPTSLRALERVDVGAGRIASCWTHAAKVVLTATGTLGRLQLHLYPCDWDGYGPRAVTLNFYDHLADTLLDSHALASTPYYAGIWASWEFTGDIRVEVVNTVPTGSNAVLNGWFLDFVDVPAAVTADVTQLVAEVVTHQQHYELLAETTQLLTEIATKPVLVAPQTTQLVVETLSQSVADAHVSQVATEVLSKHIVVTPSVSTLTTEILSKHLDVTARTSALTTEILTKHVKLKARTTQLIVETLQSNTDVGVLTGRVTQLVVETITSKTGPVQPPAIGPARISQQPLELSEQYHTTVRHGRVTQSPLEVAEQYTAVEPAHVSQAPVENAQQFTAALTHAYVSQAPVESVQQFSKPETTARVSQEVLEIIYPFGCYVFVPASACVNEELLIEPATDGSDCLAVPPIDAAPTTPPCTTPPVEPVVRKPR